MSDIRAPDWKSIKEEYIKLNGNVKLKEFAEKHKVKYSTLRSRKNRENWDNEIKNVATKSATKRKNVATKNKINKEPVAEEVKEVLENTNLTDKQRLFCVIYSRCLNATKAYKKVYGCSYETAMVEGCRALRNPKINKQIKMLNEAQFNKEFIKKSIIQKYLDIAFADITDFLEFGQEEVPVMGAFGPLKDEDGNKLTKIINVVKFKNSNAIDGTIVLEVKQGKDGASIKLQDKMKALQWLSDRMDLLPTQTRIKINNEKAKVKIAQEKLDYEKNKDNQNDKPIEILIKRKGEK